MPGYQFWTRKKAGDAPESKRQREIRANLEEVSPRLPVRIFDKGCDKDFNKASCRGLETISRTSPKPIEPLPEIGRIRVGKLRCPVRSHCVGRYRHPAAKNIRGRVHDVSASR